MTEADAVPHQDVEVDYTLPSAAEVTLRQRFAFVDGRVSITGRAADIHAILDLLERTRGALTREVERRQEAEAEVTTLHQRVEDLEADALNDRDLIEAMREALAANPAHYLACIAERIGR